MVVNVAAVGKNKTVLHTDTNTLTTFARARLLSAISINLRMRASRCYQLIYMRSLSIEHSGVADVVSGIASRILSK